MTLGNVYDLDLKKNESTIREVIIQAQGEVRASQLFDKLVLMLCKDGSRGVHQASQGNLD